MHITNCGKSIRMHFTRTVLCKEFHQRRLADDVDALSSLFVDDGNAMAMLLHESSAEVGKGAGFRHRHEGIARGQVRDGHVVGADVGELFLLGVSDFELRQSLQIKGI